MCACKVLVADGDLLKAFDTMASLDKAGHHPIGPAPDAALALALADREKPDFALVDLVLRGGESGKDLIRDLRARGIPGGFVHSRAAPAEDRRR